MRIQQRGNDVSSTWLLSVLWETADNPRHVRGCGLPVITESLSPWTVQRQIKDMAFA